MDSAFRHPKDATITQLEQQIYGLQAQTGNYDVVRTQLIELEIQYRNMMLSQVSENEKMQDRINANSSKSDETASNIEKMKEHVHLQ